MVLYLLGSGFQVGVPFGAEHLSEGLLEETIDGGGEAGMMGSLILFRSSAFSASNSLKRLSSRVRSAVNF